MDLPFLISTLTRRGVLTPGSPVRTVAQLAALRRWGFTLVGELVQTLHHDDPVDGKHEWNILSEPVRAIASGLYIYVVEDLATGEIQRGKLVIIK